MQNWLKANGFIEKNEWPPSSLDLKTHSTHWTITSGGMLEKYRKLQPNPETTDELKVALQTIWEELP